MYTEATSIPESKNGPQAKYVVRTPPPKVRGVSLVAHTLPSLAVVAVVAQVQSINSEFRRAEYLLLDGVQLQSYLICPDHMNESCAKGQKILRPSTLEEVRLWCSPRLDMFFCRCCAHTRQAGTQESVQTHAEVTAGIEKG